jgi:hypothetical protein
MAADRQQILAIPGDVDIGRGGHSCSVTYSSSTLPGTTRCTSVGSTHVTSAAYCATSSSTLVRTSRTAWAISSSPSGVCSSRGQIRSAVTRTHTGLGCSEPTANHINT